MKPSVNLILAVTVAMVIIATSAAITVLDIRRGNLAFADQIQVRGLSLSTAVSDVFAGPIASEDSQALADIANETRIRRELAYLVVFAPNGQPLWDESEVKFYSPADDFGSKAVYTETVNQRASKSLIEFASPIMLNGQAIAGVQFGFDTEAFDSELEAIVKQRLWQTAVLVLLGVIVSAMLSRWLTSPVKSLTAAVYRVSDGGEYLQETGRIAEYATLSSAVGEMVTLLQRSSEASRAEAEASRGQAEAEPASPAAEASEPDSGQAAPGAQQSANAPAAPADQPTANQQFIADAQAKLEQALRQAKAAEDAARMATKSAHTINNLVTPITAYSKMARQNLPPDSPLVSNMQEIEEAGNRIAQLATEIQQYVPEVPLIEITEPSPAESEGSSAKDDVIENNIFVDQNSTVALVVDDESMVRRVTTAILTAEGYTVLEAANGVEAVETAKQFSHIPIRLLVTDVLMPLMGAKDLAAIMSEVHPETLVVFTSGYTADSLIAHGVMDASTTFTPKPLSRESLVEKIEEAVVARTNEIQEAAISAVQGEQGANGKSASSD